MSISATEVRTRVAHGNDISALVPAPVASYIRRENLYA
jgi:nicotinic acid mononucleotide adenylyltransferase